MIITEVKIKVDLQEGMTTQIIKKEMVKVEGEIIVVVVSLKMVVILGPPKVIPNEMGKNTQVTVHKEMGKKVTSRVVPTKNEEEIKIAIENLKKTQKNSNKARLTDGLYIFAYFSYA